MYVIIGLIVAFSVACPLAFSIASVVIGAQNMATTCDHMVPSAFMSLSTWLIVYGSVSLAFVVLALLSIVLLVVQSDAFYGVYLGTNIPGGLFMLAWNIVGAVALFRDSAACQTLTYPIWAMTLAVLIFQWVGMVITCVSSARLKRDA